MKYPRSRAFIPCGIVVRIIGTNWSGILYSVQVLDQLVRVLYACSGRGDRDRGWLNFRPISRLRIARFTPLTPHTQYAFHTLRIHTTHSTHRNEHTTHNTRSSSIHHHSTAQFSTRTHKQNTHTNNNILTASTTSGSFNRSLTDDTPLTIL